MRPRRRNYSKSFCSLSHASLASLKVFVLMAVYRKELIAAHQKAIAEKHKK